MFYGDVLIYSHSDVRLSKALPFAVDLLYYRTHFFQPPQSQAYNIQSLAFYNQKITTPNCDQGTLIKEEKHSNLPPFLQLPSPSPFRP